MISVGLFVLILSYSILFSLLYAAINYGLADRINIVIYVVYLLIQNILANGGFPPLNILILTILLYTAIGTFMIWILGKIADSLSATWFVIIAILLQICINLLTNLIGLTS